MNIACPYCHQDKTWDNKQFKNWYAVSVHTGHCLKNNGEYFIDSIAGPIHKSELENNSTKYLRYLYPGLKRHPNLIRANFAERGIKLNNYITGWQKEELLLIGKDFIAEYKSIDYEKFKYNPSFPSSTTIEKYFGSWNNYLQKLGIKLNSDFGIKTYGKDNVLYRSKLEADFSNKFLYKKYSYEYEVKYPNPYKFLYDFYIKELNCYVEIAGLASLPWYMDRIIKKRKINKELNRKLIIVYPSDIRSLNDLTSNVIND